jgi:Peptidase S46
MKRILLFAGAILIAAGLSASEGKWTPQQVLELDPAWLRAQGLELSPSQLWDAGRGTGLLAAAISTGGCSGGFISDTGLFITNHHCLFSLLQEHSTPENDIIRNGFLAKSRGEELSGKSVRITIPRRFTDVTLPMLQSVPRGANDLQRREALQQKENELVAACEKQPFTRCKVASFDGGLQYMLIDALEVSDVRLVYAPPNSVGDFGGEVDNWMWPRHTGDFSIGRVYVSPTGAATTYDAANVPYKPEFFFPLSTKGVVPGDFVMALGYPGLTYRSLTAAEMAERRDLYFARRVEVYGEWIRLLEESTKGNAAGEIAEAAVIKNLNNRYKNAQGQLAGFKRGHILERQRTAEDEIAKWAAAASKDKPELLWGLEARSGLATMIEEQRKTWERDFLLAQLEPTTATPLPMGPRALYFAVTVAAAAEARQQPDAQRGALYTQRNLGRTGEKLETAQKSFYAPAEGRMLASVVRRAMALPASQRIPSLDRLFGGLKDDAAVAAKIHDLFATTKLFDLGERMKMFSETAAQLHARKDPLVELGFALAADVNDLTRRKDRWEGTVSRLRPEWRRIVIAHAGKPVAPDANSTLRVSFAHVQGYEPRDGVWYVPQTTLAGVLQKYTGEEPFDAPKRLLETAAAQKLGAWADERLKDVPVDFLADGDTTGGNSGSPMINGRGELVGINFDRVWENVANDFGFDPAVGRNISVDVRYVLWILDQVENADSLLKELGVRK